MEVSTERPNCKKSDRVWPKDTHYLFPRKAKYLLFFFSAKLLWPIVSLLSQVSLEKKKETNCWKCLKHTFKRCFRKQIWEWSYRTKPLTIVVVAQTLCVCVRVSRARVFWPDMGGGKVMTSDSLTKVWLEESCRVGSARDHGQSRGCKHKIAVTLLRIKHCIPAQH